MESIRLLFDLDFPALIVGLFMIFTAIITIVNIIGKMSEIIGKPVKWVQKKNADHELLIQTTQVVAALQIKHDKDILESATHDEKIETDLNQMSEKMDKISNQLVYMQAKNDETEMAKLKNDLITYYKKFKDVGEWSQLESDAFWDLFERYEAHGGNGYVHSTIEPTMRELNIVD